MDLSAALLKSLGVNPDDVKTGVATAQAEYASFKKGFQDATQYFNAALERVEKKQDYIISLLERDKNGGGIPLNGKAISHD